MSYNWSKQSILEVSVMATGLVSSTILFLRKKLCLWNENISTFHRHLLRALVCILFKFHASFFSCCSLTRLVNVTWFCTCPCMFHNIYVSALSSPPVNQPATLSQIQKWNTKKRCRICSEITKKKDTKTSSMLLNIFMSMRGCFNVFVDFEQISHLVLEFTLLALNR